MRNRGCPITSKRGTRATPHGAMTPGKVPNTQQWMTRIACRNQWGMRTAEKKAKLKMLPRPSLYQDKQARRKAGAHPTRTLTMADLKRKISRNRLYPPAMQKPAIRTKSMAPPLTTSRTSPASLSTSHLSRRALPAYLNRARRKTMIPSIWAWPRQSWSQLWASA